MICTKFRWSGVPIRSSKPKQISKLCSLSQSEVRYWYTIIVFTQMPKPNLVQITSNTTMLTRILICVRTIFTWYTNLFVYALKKTFFRNNNLSVRSKKVFIFFNFSKKLISKFFLMTQDSDLWPPDPGRGTRNWLSRLLGYLGPTLTAFWKNFRCLRFWNNKEVESLSLLVFFKTPKRKVFRI